MKKQQFVYLIIFAGLARTPLTAQMGDMPGMQMPGHTQKQEEAPLQGTTRQARQEGSVTPPKGTPSERRDAMHLQEPEAASMHTGDNQPAPELLKDADTHASMTLQQLEDLAVTNNPTLKQAAALQQRSLAQARQAALPPNPTVGYSGEHIRGGSYGGGEQGAYVQQDIVLGGKLALRRDVYQQTAKADALGLEQQTIRVRADVQRAFYRALAAQSSVAIRRELLAIAMDTVETAHHLANLGQADAPDILQAEVEAEQATIDYVDAQREYLQRFSTLAAFCGQSTLPLAKLSGDIEAVPDLNTDEAIAKLLNDSPEVHRAQQMMAVAQAERSSAQREPVPDLKVQAGAWNSGEQLDGTTKPAGWMGFAQVGVELPLWNRNQGGKAAAAADLSRAQSNVTRTQLQLRQQAEPLAQDYLSARFEADRYRTQLLPRAQRAYELYAMKYQSMAAPYPQVLMSQRTLSQMRMAYMHVLEKEWMSVIGLQNYTLSGGLNSPASQRLSTGENE